MQPSVNDIASLYRGNPQALQARMQKEPQLAPGIPADLKQLLALNIVTNEENGMARQQAMQQLNQMAPQGEGQMPTIAQSIQEQAKQKLQAQMMQQQQQQQAMQQMAGQMRAGSVPPGTPQPQRQPQGIDELPVEFGLAGGGIVAFKKGGDEGEEYETRIDKLYRENREDAERPERKKDQEGLLKALAFLSAPLAAAGDVVAAPFRGLYGMTQHGDTSLTPLMDARTRFLASSENAPASEAAVREVAPAQQPAARQPEAVYDPEQATRRSQYEGGIRNLVAPPRPTPPRAPTPTSSAAVAGEAPAATSQMSPLFQEAQSLEAERMRAIPEAGAANKEAGYQARVAAPDFTQRDAMIKLLQEERGRQAEPKEGWGSLMEYLGQIAATPRGMTSFEAGAAGARGQAGLQEQRAQKRFDIGSKIIEQEQGKIDASRQYAKEVYGIGEKEYDRIYKEKLDAAMQITKNEMEAKKLAQEMTLKDMDIKQRQAEEKGRNARDRVPLEQQVFAGYLKEAGGNVPKAYELMKAAGVTSTAKPMTRDQAEDNVRKDLEDFRTGPALMKDATAALKAAGVANPSTLQIKEYLVQQNMKGVSIAAPESRNTGAAPLPANATEKNLTVGTVYQTAKGPAKWTGTGFAPI